MEKSNFEVSNIRQVSKIYSQIAEMLIHKIRDFGHDRIKFSNSFRRSKIIFIHRSTKMGLFEETLKSMKIRKKIKIIDFFKMNQLLTETVILEKAQLAEVVSLLKGLEPCINAEDEKSIFKYFLT